MDNRKILIVDDEPKNLKILRLRLAHEYELEEASTGEEALRKLGSFAPALVLLDIMMDGMDGYEVLGAIRSQPRLCHTKVVLVSGKAMIEEKLEGYNAGADDYITKPFNGEELKAKVKVFVRLFNLEMELTRLNRSLEEEVKARTVDLIKAETMAAVGLRTAEIIHNLKNPLAIVMGHLMLLKRKGEMSDTLRKIDDATNRIHKIIVKTLDTVRTDQERVTCSFEEVIKQEAEFVKNLDGIPIQFRVLPRGSDEIFMARTHFSQVMSNLMGNAVEAIQVSGKPERMIVVEKKDFFDFSVVTIRDSGNGIADEHLEKIFESQFTTKDGTNGNPLGSGIGLAYCKKVVESYGGTIVAKKLDGVGAEFEVRIPIKPSKALPRSA